MKRAPKAKACYPGRATRRPGTGWTVLAPSRRLAKWQGIEKACKQRVQACSRRRKWPRDARALMQEAKTAAGFPFIGAVFCSRGLCQRPGLANCGWGWRFPQCPGNPPQEAGIASNFIFTWAIFAAAGFANALNGACAHPTPLRPGHSRPICRVGAHSRLPRAMVPARAPFPQAGSPVTAAPGRPPAARGHPLSAPAVRGRAQRPGAHPPAGWKSPAQRPAPPA